MSLLPSATFATSIAPTGGASDYAANALWATAGASGPGGGVTQLVAGANITLDPPTGEGVVTITAAGAAGGVTSVTSGGPGITCIPTTGAVVVDNTGVTSLVAGTAMSISGATGAVTVNNAGVTALSAGPGIAVSGATGAVTVSAVGFPAVGFQNFVYDGNEVTFTVTGDAFRIEAINTSGNMFVDSASTSGWKSRNITITNPTWNEKTVVVVCLGGGFLSSSSGSADAYLSGIVTCGRLPGFAATNNRTIIMSGGGSVLPVRLGGLFNGEAAIYGWVAKGV